MLSEMRAKRAGSGEIVIDMPFMQRVFEDPEMEFLMQTYDKLRELDARRSSDLYDGGKAVEEVSVKLCLFLWLGGRSGCGT